METLDLFSAGTRTQCQTLGRSAMVLRRFALPYVPDLMLALTTIEAVSPFRHMVTPGGFTMSVALTNCGALGWTTDRGGYRYTDIDPDSGRHWPATPGVFAR